MTSRGRISVLRAESTVYVKGKSLFPDPHVAHEGPTSNDRIFICNRCSLLERAHSFPSIRLDVITLPVTVGFPQKALHPFFCFLESIQNR